MTVHISREGIQEDDQGFPFVHCDCGVVIGPGPDNETLLDMAMEHAHARGWVEAMTQEHPPKAADIGSSPHRSTRDR